MSGNIGHLMYRLANRYSQCIREENKNLANRIKAKQFPELWKELEINKQELANLQRCHIHNNIYLLERFKQSLKRNGLFEKYGHLSINQLIQLIKEKD